MKSSPLHGTVRLSIGWSNLKFSLPLKWMMLEPQTISSDFFHININVAFWDFCGGCSWQKRLLDNLFGIRNPKQRYSHGFNVIFWRKEHLNKVYRGSDRTRITLKKIWRMAGSEMEPSACETYRRCEKEVERYVVMPLRWAVWWGGLLWGLLVNGLCGMEYGHYISGVAGRHALHTLLGITWFCYPIHCEWHKVTTASCFWNNLADPSW